MFRLRDKRRRRLRGRHRRTQRFTPGLETLEDRRVLASIIWDGGGSDHHWNNPANWFDVTNEMDDVLPTSDDHVVIRDQFAGITVLVDDNVALSSLHSAAGLNILSNVDFALQADSQIDGPVQLAGRLGGSGTVTFTDSLTWTNGTMADDGATVIAAGATLTIDGSVGISDATSEKPMRTIDNFGTIQWVSGNIGAQDRLTLHNRPDAIIDIQSNSSLGHNASGRILINEGTLRKSGGGGTSEIRMRLENTGTVEVQRGTLALVRGGFSTGHLSFDAGTTLEFQDNSVGPSLFTITLEPQGTSELEGSLIGEGRLLVASREGVFIEGDGELDLAMVEIAGSFGRLRLNRDASISQVLVSGGTLGGTGTLTVTESLRWTSGNMTDGGTTVIDSGATMAIDGSMSVFHGAIYGGGRTIENLGTIEVIQGDINATGSAPLTVNNHAGALFDIRTNNSIGNTGSRFNNAGTLRKSAGGGTSEIRMLMENTGTVEVQSGTLGLGRGGFSTGHLSFDAGTTLDLMDNSARGGRSLFEITLDSTASLIGDGRLLIGAREGVFIEGDGLLDVALVETVGFGRLRLHRDASIPQVLVSGGTVGGTGTLTVTERLDWTGGSMADGGTTVIAEGATLAIDNPRGKSVSGDAVQDGGRIIENFGTIEWIDGNVSASGSHPLIINNRSGALFDIRADNTLGNTGSRFNNEGTLRKATGGGTAELRVQLDHSGAIEVSADQGLNATHSMTQSDGTTQLDGGALIVSDGLFLSGGVLEGDGTIQGDVTQSGGSIQPGLSLGILTIDGDYASSSGELLVEIAGPPTDDEGNDLTGTNYDRLQVTGDVLLGGHLQVEVVGGYGLERDDVYDIMTVEGLDGGFLSTNAGEHGISVLVQPRAVQLQVDGRTITWDGGGDGVLWHDPLNWSSDQLPGSADEVILNAGDAIVIEDDANVFRVQVDDGASLFMYNSHIDAAIDLGGDLTVRGASRIGNDLTTSTSSTVTLSGFGRSGASRQGDAVLTVGGDFLHQGELIFHGREAVRVHPTWVGDEVRLVMSQGTFINQGHVWTREPTVESTDFHFAIIGAVENRGLIELVGEDLRIESAVFLQHGNVLVHGGRSLRVDGDYTQSDEGRLVVALEGDVASGRFGQVDVDGTANLSGTMELQRLAGFYPTVGETYGVMTFSESAGAFAELLGLHVGDRQIMEVHQLDEAVQVEVVQSANDIEELQNTFNAGIVAVSDALPKWGELFDLKGINLPVSVDALDGLFDISGDDGLLRAIADDALTTVDQPVDSLQSLVDEIDSLPGMAVISVSGDPGAEPTDLLVIRWEHAIGGLQQTADVDDATHTFLTELAAAANLEGALEYTAELRLRLVFGVDTAGFFVRGDSSAQLDVMAQGVVATSFDLQVPGLRMNSAPDSSASANLEVVLTGGGESQRLRIDQLPEPVNYLQPMVDGTAHVGLGLGLDVLASPSDVEFTANWNIAVSENQVGVVDSEIDYPSLDELIHALLPIVESEFPKLFGDAWSELLDAVPLPMTAGEFDAEPDETSGWWPEVLDTAGALFADIDLDGAKRGIELLSELVTVEATIGIDEIPDLFAGELSSDSNLLSARFVADSETSPTLTKSFDFALGAEELGGFHPGSLAGDVAATLQPLASIGFGIDAGGFFFASDSQLGGTIEGAAAALGMIHDFEVEVTGQFTLSPRVRFAEGLAAKLRPQALPDHLVNDLDLVPGPVTGSSIVDLGIGLFDYVDVDGDESNNTEQGGDPFTVRGVASLSADLSTIDPAELEAFEYEFGALELLNPDIDQDGEEDFTLAVLSANVISLAKGVARGERTLFGQEFSAALNSTDVPLTDNPLGDSLGIGDKLRSLFDGDSGQGDDLIEVLHTADFPYFRSMLNDGLDSPTLPFSDLARFKLSLAEVPLAGISDALQFDLSTVLPDTVNVEGRADIENATLNGALVFGIDTMSSPFYLLAAPDDLTPGDATTIGGGFDLFVNVDGEPLGSGLVTLHDGDARMSPEIVIGFGEPGVQKVRIGQGFSLIQNTAVSLSGHTQLVLTANGAAITPGPLVLFAEDDDPSNEIAAVRGVLDVATGAIDVQIRHVTGVLDDLLQLTAESGGDGSPAVVVTFEPNQVGTEEPLLVARNITAALSALSLNEITPEFSLPSLTVRHDGTVGVPRLVAGFDGGLAEYIGVGGVLPLDVSQVSVDFPNSSDLNELIVGVRGEFDFDSHDLPFDAAVTVDGELKNGPFDVELDLDAARDGLFRPRELGPLVVSISAFELPETDVTLAGEVQIGRLDSQGLPQTLPGRTENLVGSFEVISGNEQFRADLQIDVAGHVTFGSDDSATLNAAGHASLGTDEFGDAAARFRLMMEARRLANAPYFDLQVDARLMEVTLTDVKWDFSPVAIVRAAQVQYLPEVGINGEVADLIDLEIEWLPGEQGPLAMMTVARATGFDEDGGDVSIDSFRIEDASLSRADLIIGDPAQPLLTLDDVLLRVPELSNQGGILFGEVQLEATGGTLLADGPFSAAVTDDDPEDGVPALIGNLSFAAEAFELTADRVTAEVGAGWILDIDDATLHLKAEPSPEDSLLFAETATLTVPVIDEDVALRASELHVNADGDVSMASAEAAADQGLVASLGLAGLLPLDLMRVAIEGIDSDGDGDPNPISLTNFDSDITVEGYLNDSLFDETGFSPIVSIGGTERPAGPGNEFTTTFRMVDGVIVPWETGSIALGFQASTFAEGFHVSNQLTLGGYEQGQWQTSLSGSLSAEVVLDDGGSASGEIAIRESSSLDVDQGILVIDGLVQFDGEVSGSYGGVSIGGGSLGFTVVLDVDPRDDSPGFGVAAFDVTFNDLTIDQVMVEVANLFTLTATDLNFFSSPAADGALASIGSVEVVTIPNSPLEGLAQASAVLNNARLYEDRMAFSSSEEGGADAVFTLRGVLTAGDHDLLYVQDAELAFTDVVFAFGDFDPFSGELVTLDGLDASASGVAFSLGEGVLLPDSTDGEGVPNGLASVHDLQGTFEPDGTLIVDVAEASAELDLFAVHFTGSRLALGPQVADQPLLATGQIEMTVPLFEDVDVVLTASDLKVWRDGRVTLLSAVAEADEGFLESIGLGGLIPLDLTSVSIAGIDSDGDGFPDESLLLNHPLANTAFDITVGGVIDLSPFEDLPVEPTVVVGDSADNPFEATFRYADHQIQVWNVPRIELGLSIDLGDLGDGVEMAGSLYIGDQQDGLIKEGVFTGKLGGTLEFSGGVGEGYARADLVVDGTIFKRTSSRIVLSRRSTRTSPARSAAALATCCGWDRRRRIRMPSRLRSPSTWHFKIRRPRTSRLRSPRSRRTKTRPSRIRCPGSLASIPGR